MMLMLVETENINKKSVFFNLNLINLILNQVYADDDDTGHCIEYSKMNDKITEILNEIKQQSLNHT